MSAPTKLDLHPSSGREAAEGPAVLLASQPSFSELPLSEGTAPGSMSDTVSKNQVGPGSGSAPL